MKNIIGVILSIIAGGFIGFFGVSVSVFADSPITERLVTIGIILLINYVLSSIWGLWLPNYSWKWGLFIGAPGVFFLGLYMINEYNFYYLIYMALIICFSSFGAWCGSSIRNIVKK